MKIRPTGNNVLIKRDPEPDKTDGGIVHTCASRRAVWTGTVAAVGPGVVHHKWAGPTWRDNLDLDAGDRVQLETHSEGMYLTIGGDPYVMIDRKHILAKGVE